MKIGIDISPLQTAHRLRGIGYTLTNLINNLPDELRKNHTFVLYMDPDDSGEFGDTLGQLNLENLRHEIRSVSHQKKISRRLPGRLNLFISAVNSLLALKNLAFGNPNVGDVSDLDVYLQTDQNQSLPRRRALKKALIVYDIIPYVLESDYLWSYKTARFVHGFSRKAAFRCAVRRELYFLKLKLNVRRAQTIIAISETTAKDFRRVFNIPSSRISVAPLGVNRPPKSKTAPSIKRYVETGWGYQTFDYSFDDTPFLLFVGGADKRRKLQDLIAGFNNLRAQGIAIKLVLVGDSMQGPHSIATEEIQESLAKSSYLDDIVFLGYVDDQTRDWLYRHALAFVFPSRYEGFGLPILEAFVHECPVLCYQNAAVTEVAGAAPIYVNSIEDIMSETKKLLEMPEKERRVICSAGLRQAEKFGWTTTSNRMISLLGKD